MDCIASTGQQFNCFILDKHTHELKPILVPMDDTKFSMEDDPQLSVSKRQLPTDCEKN